MNISWPIAGRYILAISGGADSMVLLDLMARAASKRQFDLVVAHFDHGLRASSASDRRLVGASATAYGLAFEYRNGKLGEASEAQARAARHDWLEGLRHSMGAVAVVTAHHQDDLLETSLLNLARGTGRRGLAPMQTGQILRPLLACSRAQLRAYAGEQGIRWHEDPTNTDLSNPRNFLRHALLSRSAPGWRAQYLAHLSNITELNTKITQNLQALMAPARVDDTHYCYPRAEIAALSLPELEELLVQTALELSPSLELDRRVVQEVALFAKTASPRRRRALRQGVEVHSYRDSISVLAF